MKAIKLLTAGLLFCTTTGVVSAQSQKKVLQELWSNSNCAPCANFHNMMEQQVADNPGDVIYIGWHCNYPDPLDPMYLENTAEQDYMMDFYTIYGVPDLPSNGNVGAHLSYQSEIDSVLAMTVPIELHPKLEINGSTLDAEVNVLTTGVPPTGSNLVLRVAITETLDFQTPPGSINLTHFPDVFRKYLTATPGDAYVAAVTGDSVTYNFSMQMPQHWDPAELKIKAWVIDTTNIAGQQSNYPIYDVINSAEASPEIHTAIVEAGNGTLSVDMYPNPTQTDIYLDIHATIGAQTSISVFNTAGQKVLVETYFIQSGNNRIQLATNQLDAGVYFVTIESDTASRTEKLVIH